MDNEPRNQYMVNWGYIFAIFYVRYVYEQRFNFV